MNTPTTGINGKPWHAVFSDVLAEGSDIFYDQPCKFGKRVETHAIYCQNHTWTEGPRKCRNTWYSHGKYKDEDCEGFEPNPEYKKENTHE